jgi:hypothetical protein
MAVNCFRKNIARVEEKVKNIKLHGKKKTSRALSTRCTAKKIKEKK